MDGLWVVVVGQALIFLNWWVLWVYCWSAEIDLSCLL